MIDELFKVQVKEYVGVEMLPKARCLGWQTKDPASSAGELVSENTILHTGFTGTNMFIDKDNEVGFVLLANRVHPTRNNSKQFHVRACVANYLMSHLEEFK
jgi:CubicO group peptidase (beta-lactamase class C family)